MNGHSISTSEFPATINSVGGSGSWISGAPVGGGRGIKVRERRGEIRRNLMKLKHFAGYEAHC